MSNKPNNQWLISSNQAKEISGLLSGYKVQARIDEILESLPEASFEQAAPTPEQIAKWRKKFESRYHLSQLGTIYERYLDLAVREAWGNYVEAREDALTEQAAEIAALKAQIEHLKQVIIGDRIEWEDFPTESRLAFAQLVKD